MYFSIGDKHLWKYYALLSHVHRYVILLFEYSTGGIIKSRKMLQAELYIKS